MIRAVTFAIAIATCACGQAPLDLSVAPIPSSNVRAADYVGPQVCGECHGKQFEQWSGNLHRAMNRPTTDQAAVIGDFSGVEVAYAGGVARFERQGVDPVMILRAASGRESTFRVTRTIGGRYIQEYVGVEVALEASPIEVRLPFGYWLREKRWFHQQYFDSWFDHEYEDDGATPAIDAYDVDRTPWATRCAWCHNTYPFELRLARATAGVGVGPETLYRIDDAPSVSGNHLPLESLVTVGISCESCHFGGREHAGGAAIEFRPRGVGLSAVGPSMSGARTDARTINLVCMQCHSGPSPKWPSGASKRNSSEALDLVSGACASAIKCTDCHDPHPRGSAAGSATSQQHVAACLGCHLDKSGEQHSQHAGDDANCIDCHMPRITSGFSGPLRTHHISSPSPAQVLAGREPDACGLCHLDRSSRQLTLDLALGWKAPAAASDSGQLDIPIGERWLRSVDPAVRAVALAAYGTGRVKTAALLVAEKLDEPIAYYRMRAFFALEEILGRDIEPSEFDPSASPSQRAAALSKLIESLR